MGAARGPCRGSRRPRGAGEGEGRLRASRTAWRDFGALSPHGTSESASRRSVLRQRSRSSRRPDATNRIRACVALPVAGVRRAGAEAQQNAKAGRCCGAWAQERPNQPIAPQRKGRGCRGVRSVSRAVRRPQSHQLLRPPKCGSAYVAPIHQSPGLTRSPRSAGFSPPVFQCPQPFETTSDDPTLDNPTSRT
jgi:hypothetical protein